MKKLLAILLSLAMTATLAACSDSFEPLERVTVSTDYPAAIMVDGSVYFKGGETVDVGDTVEIRWDGMLQESYPGGMSNVYGVNVEEQGNDILGAYRAAFAYLQEADSGLDNDVEQIVLDLQATSNHLTTTEKEALTYLIAYGVQDCEVVFDNDGNFTLTTGDEWIS